MGTLSFFKVRAPFLAYKSCSSFTGIPIPPAPMAASSAVSSFLAQLSQHEQALESCISDLIHARGALFVKMGNNQEGPPLYLQTKCYQSLDNIISVFVRPWFFPTLDLF